ncbi:transposase [Paenibacillus sp. FSL K6-1217]|uniref:transposase n=1 Tax=Paenibacillus sp. FSL K6-1217 TaxID=2921466 RepID=UPI0038679600
MDTPCFGVGWTFALGEDAPRTTRCSNRCALQIFFIPLSGENPETKATTIAFPQSFRSLRCLSGKWTQYSGKIENWAYDEAEDRWTCPAGQTLYFFKESKEILESGYEIRKRHYRSQNCEGCPLKVSCTKASGNREVVVSLERLRSRKAYLDN